MTSFLENPLLIVGLGLLTATILGGAWLQTGQRSLLVGLIVALAATGCLLLLERWVESPREQVEATLRRAARDVERNDLRAVLAHIHPQAEWIKPRVEAEFPQYEFRQVRIARDLEITVLENESPPKAVATFNVFVTFREKSGTLGVDRAARFVTVTFLKDGNDWRFADYTHQDITRGFKRRKSK